MVAPHIDALRQRSYDDIQASFPDFDIRQVHLIGDTHPSHQRLDKYLKSPGNLGYTRAFLYHEVGLSALYGGQGVTMREDGGVGIKEYLTPNRLLRDLPAYAFIDLPLSIEELGDDDNRG